MQIETVKNRKIKLGTFEDFLATREQLRKKRSANTFAMADVLNSIEDKTENYEPKVNIKTGLLISIKVWIVRRLSLYAMNLTSNEKIYEKLVTLLYDRMNFEEQIRK